jgi:class 3 adenylate cyclase
LWAATATNSFVDNERYQTLIDLAKRDWALFAETFAHVYLGWAPGSQAHWWASFIRESTNSEDFVEAMRTLPRLGVTEIMRLVKAPTLVLHQPGLYGGTPGLSESQALASGIPNARLVQLSEQFVPPYGNEPGTSAVEAFLAEAEDSAVTSAPPSGTAIILFADIVDSTALTESLGDAAFRTKARDLDAAPRTVIRDHSGTPIEGKLLGDGVLAVFTSARQAIEAALACGKAGEEGGLPLHLGLHAGDVIRESDPDGRNNVYGGAVNIASRISGLSASGEVLVSETVRSLARTSAGVTFEDRGEQALKGVGEAVRVWRIVSESGSE